MDFSRNRGCFLTDGTLVSKEEDVGQNRESLVAQMQCTFLSHGKGFEGQLISMGFLDNALSFICSSTYNFM